MSRVFVIQSTRRQADVGPAAVYGSIVFVLGPEDRTSSQFSRSEDKLRRALLDFREDEDYVLWSGGDPLSLLLTGFVMAELGIPHFRYLRYEKPDARVSNSAPYYVPITVTPALRLGD